MTADEYTVAVEAAARTLTINRDDFGRIASAMRRLDEAQSIFTQKQKVTLAVHFAAFLDRVRSGGSLPPVGDAAADEVSDGSLERARTVLEGLSAAPTTKDEALLVAIHRDAALITHQP